MEAEEHQAFALVFGQIIGRIRRDKGLSQAQLGERVGIAQSTISRIEAGTLDVPITQLRQIAVSLDVSPEAIVTRGEEVFAKVGEAASQINDAQPWWRPALQADLQGLASFVVSSTWEPL